MRHLLKTQARDFLPMALFLKSIFLADGLNSDKKNGNNKDIQSALNARIQTRANLSGAQRPRHRGGGAYLGRVRPHAVQFGQGA